MTPATAPSLVEAARAARALRRLRGVNDPSTFLEVTIRDEDGLPLRQTVFHREWQDAITGCDRLVLFAPVEHGKTTQMWGRVLWELGTRLTRGEYPRILLVSRTQRQAAKVLETIKSHIERNADLHAVFPVLRRQRFDKWTGSFIRFRPLQPTTAKDHTLEVVGIDGAVLGGRFDIVILDDVLDLENTWTSEQRRKVIEWYDAVIPGRVVANGKIIIIGTAWHPHDLMHELAKRKGFVARRYSAHDGRWNPIWPEHWSRARLEARRAELTPYRFAQQMECKAVTDDTSRFQLDWFAGCAAQGKGLAWPQGDPMDITVTGLDLGVKRKAGSDETAFFVMGADKTTGRRRILYITHGRWLKKEIIARAVALWRKYGGIFVVEDNAAQNYLTQDLQQDTPIPVWPYQTKGRRKRDPVFGIESIGVELENRKWELPCDANGHMPEAVQLWRDQCLEWKPTEHSGDLVMASFFALEGIRRHEMFAGGVSIG